MSENLNPQLSFLNMTRTKKLSLLGDMYRMMFNLRPGQVNLDTIHCGSAGCLAGWCSVDPELSKRLHIGYNSRLGEIVSTTRAATVIAQFIGIFLFKEEAVNHFLFAPHSHLEDKNHRITTLTRLLYMGGLVNTGRDRNIFTNYVTRGHQHPYTNMALNVCALQEHAARSTWIREHLGLTVKKSHHNFSYADLNTHV